jgi:predicted O-methyltransferase YrrM
MGETKLEMGVDWSAERGAFLEAFGMLARGFMESRAILTAIELDVFTAVGHGGTAAEIAQRLGADERGAGFLLHHLAATGLVEKRDGIFRNAASAAKFLDGASPECAREGMLHMVHLWDRWSGLSGSVRTGKPAPREEEGRSAESAERFIAAMHANASQRAPHLVRAIGTAGISRMLDVGGGSGAVSLAFAAANPALRAEIFDLDDVVPIAAAHAKAAGLADRVTTRVGDMRRDDFGAGYELVLLSAVCHMFGPDENADLLRRAAAALAPGGRVVVHDHLLQADGAGPRPGTLFALNMLVNTERGGNFTEEQYRGWMTAAGLADVRCVAPPGPLQLMIGRKP